MLNGRGASSASQGKGKERALAKATEPTTNWGSGNSLSSRSDRVGAGGASVPVIPQRKSAGKSQPVVQRSPSPDWGVDDDDDVIVIDSD